MCGIVGIVAFNDSGRQILPRIEQGVKAITQRGPDSHDHFIDGDVALGHTRLSIIDPRPEGIQPMTDTSGKYTIVFNGEFYNYQEHRQRLEKEGYPFKTFTDTEVILALYITKGLSFLDDLNGCFAFALYDRVADQTLIVRDRFGIKPLVYWHTDSQLIFSSEIKGISAIQKPTELNESAITTYFQLNYIPHPDTIYEGVKKLAPGHYILVKGSSVSIKQYFSHKNVDCSFVGSYEEAKDRLANELEEAVRRRLVSDVPLGCFLSGGIDSSVVSALASKHVDGLQTFSVGYKDNPFFDETKYANLVAQKFNTNHTVFSLDNDDLLEHVYDTLDYFDEPFADSSALPVHILSKLTKQYVTVSLSGDGADEIFAGYNKHAAFNSIINNRSRDAFLKIIEPFLKVLPQSRNNIVGNTVRKAVKYIESSKLSNADLYWRLCSIWRQNETQQILKKTNFAREPYLSYESPNDLQESLLNDIQLVLTNDMLYKVDSMSMANGLEVRVPFLDKHVYEFGFSIPDDFKLNGNFKKRILQDTFRDILPEELYKRPKHGFEVPLLNWFKNEMKGKIDEYFSQDLIEDQGIFNYSEVKSLKQQLYSLSPADATAKTWAMISFQHWWIHKYNT